MSEEDLIAEAKSLSGWQKHKFMLLVGATIAIALVLVGVSLQLYNTSGAVQLDLSRPGYQSIRNKANNSGDFKDFPSSGAINMKTLEEFRKMYDTQLKNATAVDSFGEDVLSDEALGLSTTPAQ